ncbi:hypothetical protein FRC0411_02048 [Corynebacterium diphtheriae]|nr:hypothetical protein FRC0411_02048 [Corynebacterium diphtheriae]CAB0965542.1 hypothetical protein FRC0478_01784 [Corynebacterium diphtheriae]CAB0968832.1 hypothetical protein FRC0475_01967 [Corynebacterium diphtheriae]CAB1008379.1 hypothetical protein FRC0492_01991 [Corynebacterium diphtheriae]CAB1023028.1 hypothetical protein FRC0524_01987 [Corynebacterium diphtheriae]
MVLPSCAILAILGVFYASKRVDKRAHGFVGCLHVGHSLMGSALMMVTITVFCGAVDGIADGIFVGLHGRCLVLYGWFRYLCSYKAKDPKYLVPRPNPGVLINAL